MKWCLTSDPGMMEWIDGCCGSFVVVVDCSVYKLVK